MKSEYGSFSEDRIRETLEKRVAHYREGGDILPVGSGIPCDMEQHEIWHAVTTGGDVDGAEAALWARFDQLFPPL
ncbi:hypothetical protein ASE48_08460 [Mycobacterium sp. Root265]|uniref:hypothetical protein n=1 Tax=Mycobacterium sp. Root265 TaxID=1736504 RepID=UPI00070E3D32|nr:hypothetical protein [Mycobacterium sp. Root265]KRD08586.1 hypothetical protein ASE48_08460 [Mycobacterium sp. Root265]